MNVVGVRMGHAMVLEWGAGRGGGLTCWKFFCAISESIL